MIELSYRKLSALYCATYKPSKGERSRFDLDCIRIQDNHATATDGVQMLRVRSGPAADQDAYLIHRNDVEKILKAWPRGSARKLGVATFEEIGDGLSASVVAVKYGAYKLLGAMARSAYRYPSNADALWPDPSELRETCRAYLDLERLSPIYNALGSKVFCRVYSTNQEDNTYLIVPQLERESSGDRDVSIMHLVRGVRDSTQNRALALEDLRSELTLARGDA